MRNKASRIHPAATRLLTLGVISMVAKSIRAASFGAAVTVLGALSCAGSAEAAVYQGSWDPGYGGIFPDLGWSASASFDVPTSCLTQGNGTYGVSGACAGFSVLSAQLDFYNMASTSTILESFNLNKSVTVTGVQIAGNQLVGVDTVNFASVVPIGGSRSIAGGGAYAFSLILYNGTLAQLNYLSPVNESPGCVQYPSAGTDCGSSKNFARGVITAVPEPETYALMLAGLGAIGWVARRRSQQNATA